MSTAPLDQTVVSHAISSMGGTVEVAIATAPELAAGATAAAVRTCGRIEAWAGRLTRFTEVSDLAQLNRAPQARVEVRPTLGAVLRWAAAAQQRSEGVVDATLLEERLAAESGAAVDPSRDRSWRMVDLGRTVGVERSNAFRFDLDGVAKGWIADRAADLLLGWPAAVVDADGDVAFQLDPGTEWPVDIADPRSAAAPPLATLRLSGGDSWRRAFGVATSGTSVHRWSLADGRRAHHLIDRRTGRPAETDIVQATVVAPSAREAEMIAKSAVILGSDPALDYLTRSAAHTAVLLLESGALVAMPGVESWLA